VRAYREPVAARAGLDWVRRHGVLVDTVAAGLLALIGIAGLVDPPGYVDLDFHEPDALGVALVLLTSAPVALRSRVPVPAFAVSMAASLVLLAMSYAQSMGGVASLLVLYSVASRCSLRTGVMAAVVGWLALAVALLASPVDVAPTDWIGNTFVLTTGWAVGRAVATHRQNLAALQERNRALEAARESELRAALVEERGRLAGEMHDIVAHSLTAMTVQAAAARRLVRRDPDSAEQVLDAVQGAGRSALEELRRVLGVLTHGEHDPELGPQPGTADLPVLVERVSTAGLDVVLEQEGTPVALDPGVDLAAYRIVQESLTNALKHAGPARVRVRLAWAADRLEICVEDDGRGAAPVAGGTPRGTGRGLVLLRERAGAYGGSVQAGPRRGGGYALSATLPTAQVAR
jgi:signal transduction histidine kinase